MPWLVRYTAPSVDGAPAPSNLLDRHGALLSAIWDLGTSGIAEAGPSLLAGFDRLESARSAHRLAAPHGLVAAVEPVDDGWIRHEQVEVEVVTAVGIRSFPIVAAAAFGHGGHPTTRLCLDLMSRVYGATGSPTAPGAACRRVLDLGTGSGVLAIAAHHLGATAITACDVDPAAVDAARFNTTANGLDIELIHGDVAEVAGRVDRTGARFDLIVANVLLVVHEQVAATVGPLLTSDGVLVLAGFLTDQADRVVSAYRGARPALDVMERADVDGWCGMTLAG
ncbi:MAG: 50S ribosomal protein L11 methyltransferase [Acidimicrobiia bacterium]|nr:50S ribosomal protein L11 methyltransferase [Acidimicrobiia bacterium]